MTAPAGRPPRTIPLAPMQRARGPAVQPRKDEKGMGLQAFCRRLKVLARRAPALAGIICLTGASVARAEPAGPVRFNRDVRPILSENCFACHGPDRNQRKADLRLDTSDGLLAKMKHGTPVVPSKPQESEVFTRIVHADPDEVMPPPKTGKKLTAAQVDT